VSATKPTYARLSDAEILRVFRSLKRVIPEFLFDVAKYPANLKYNISDSDLISMIIQVDRRCAHYEFFHNGMQINESKKLGVTYIGF
jgi:hypothetical protein